MTDIDGKARPADFCRLVGVSRQRLTTLREKNAVTGTTLAEWVASYCEHLRETAAGRADGDGPLVLAVERAALARAQRERLHREEQVALRQLLPVAEVRRGWQTIIGDARQRLLGLPSAVTPFLVGEQDASKIFKVLTDSVHETLSELSRGGDGTPKSTAGAKR